MRRYTNLRLPLPILYIRLLCPASFSLLTLTISDRRCSFALLITSSLITWLRHEILMIVQIHLWWNISNLWRMLAVLFHVSDACSAVGSTIDMQSRSLVILLMVWLDPIGRRIRWKTDDALPSLLSSVCTAVSDCLEILLPRNTGNPVGPTHSSCC